MRLRSILITDVKWSESCDRLSRFCDHWIWMIFMTIVTLISLYIDDIQSYWFSRSSDPIFALISSIIFCLFSFELILLCLANMTTYPLSLFFFLDLVSIVAILPQTSFASGALLGDAFTSSSASNLSLIRAARASRAGTRAARILRISRVIRILRLAKFSKILVQRIHRNWSSASTIGYGPDLHIPHTRRSSRNKMRQSAISQTRDSSIHPNPDPMAGDQSRVGAVLADLTSQRLALMVLSLLFLLRLIAYHDDRRAPLMALDQIAHLNQARHLYGPIPYNPFNLTTTTPISSNSANNSSWPSLNQTAMMLIQFQDDQGIQPWTVLALHLQDQDGNIFTFESTALSQHRTEEIDFYQIDDHNDIALSDRDGAQRRALYSIGQTTFIIILLGLGALLFIRDAQTFILHPIERMTRAINRLRTSPLTKKQHTPGDAREADTLETAMLEHTLEKLTGLLQIGFGEAGSAMIQKNINANGELNSMIDGQRILAIFGFCHIRGFAHINAQLQENIMLFVNEIAEIVHSQVRESGGAVNRNLGETFVLVWKLPQGIRTDRLEWILEHDPTGSDPETNLTPAEINALEQVRQTAAHALAAFIRVICLCSKPSTQLQQLIESSNRAKGNDGVSVGLGLHVGWAIEGAIGSRFKIDASYLSPNVNMASRLMAATKQYRIPLLFSNQFWSILPISAQNRCRQVDRVAVKGSNVPIGLYTFDMNPSLAVIRSSHASSQSIALISMTRSAIERRQREHRNKIRIRPVDFNNNKLLCAIQNGVAVKSFRENYEEGLAAYLQGNWPKAMKLFEIAIRFKPLDGPTETLLTYMRSYESCPPKFWSGYRPLYSK